MGVRKVAQKFIWFKVMVVSKLVILDCLPRLLGLLSTMRVTLIVWHMCKMIAYIRYT